MMPHSGNTGERGAWCIWYCCGREIARAGTAADRGAAIKVAAHKKEHTEVRR